MPKNAKVFLVDDNDNVRTSVRECLEKAEHRISAEAASFKEAIEKIDYIFQQGVTVAILDGSLSPPGSTFKAEGREISLILRKKIPRIKIISLSSHLAGWGDANLVKGVETLSRLGKIVDDL